MYNKKSIDEKQARKRVKTLYPINLIVLIRGLNMKIMTSNGQITTRFEAYTNANVYDVGLYHPYKFYRGKFSFVKT